jgi:hypothetical protein
MSIKEEYNDCEENQSVSQIRLTIEIIEDIDRYDGVLCLIFFVVIKIYVNFLFRTQLE